MIAVRLLRIRGIVQGVGYRASFTREARRRGLAGWVRNRLDGSVEAVVQGDEQAVAEIIDWAWRGPPAASVDRVEVREAAEAPEAAEARLGHRVFEQRPTE